MPNITFARVDHRLIHGQVITKWSKIAAAQKILIVDDVLAQDSFMVDIYKMAAPSGVDVDIKSAEDTARAYQADDLGSGNVFLLFKSIQTARKALSSRPCSWAAFPPRPAERSSSRPSRSTTPTSQTSRTWPTPDARSPCRSSPRRPE